MLLFCWLNQYENFFARYHGKTVPTTTDIITTQTISMWKKNISFFLKWNMLSTKVLLVDKFSELFQIVFIMKLLWIKINHLDLAANDNSRILLIYSFLKFILYSKLTNKHNIMHAIKQYPIQFYRRLMCYTNTVCMTVLTNFD